MIAGHAGPLGYNARMHVVAAMSGGVDSSVAAALLQSDGHQVTGVFLRNGVHAGPAAARNKQGCCSIGDAQDAARVADLLDIPFYALDFAAEFDALIDDFAAAYAGGRTPNPCIACNRDLKLGRLLRFADGIGAEAIATGHYARSLERDGRAAVAIPADAHKDQTYVLFPLSQEQLRRTLFPLGDLTKTEVRAVARERSLPVHDKPDSMEICFVPGGDYRAVVAERAPEAVRPGPVLDARSGARVGEHAGVGSVTIGQRRGLGIAAASPLYVTRIDPATNTVLVGCRDDLLMREVDVAQWNDVAACIADGPLAGSARVRRNHTPQAATAERDAGADGAAIVVVRFRATVAAPAPGQALVLYDDAGAVLGGGWIVGSRR